MASILGRNGRRSVQFYGPDGARKTLSLGKVSQRQAETVRLKVESLLASAITGCAPDRETAAWLTTLDDVMTDKLASAGLIARRSSATLGGFLAEYLTSRIDVKPATREVWSQVERNLKEHFSEGRALRTITPGDAEGFRLYLVAQGLAPTTVSKRLQFARQFFRAAMKHKLITENPFAEVRSKAATDSGRQRFISRDDTAKLLEACPSLDWRLIVALARYGGLRCPSEVLSLRWQDVDAARGRLTVTSPKTEHHPGKDTRVIPLFPELRSILQDAFDAAPDGSVYVVNERFRQSSQGKAGWRNCNLRTSFEKIIRRAGLTPWPRLFHNLRSSRETELVQAYPVQVVTAWLGNTPAIALKHYLQTTDEHFAQALSGSALLPALPYPSANVTPSGTLPVVTCGKASQENETTPCETRGCTETYDRLPSLTKIISGEDRIRTCGPL